MLASWPCLAQAALGRAAAHMHMFDMKQVRGWGGGGGGGGAERGGAGERCAWEEA